MLSFPCFDTVVGETGRTLDLQNNFTSTVRKCGPSVTRLTRDDLRRNSQVMQNRTMPVLCRRKGRRKVWQRTVNHLLDRRPTGFYSIHGLHWCCDASLQSRRSVALSRDGTYNSHN